MTIAAAKVRWLDFDKEEDLVAAIRRDLLTDRQATWLHVQRLSIEDILNGRFAHKADEGVQQMFRAWNARIGRQQFGY